MSICISCRFIVIFLTTDAVPLSWDILPPLLLRDYGGNILGLGKSKSLNISFEGLRAPIAPLFLARLVNFMCSFCRLYFLPHSLFGLPDLLTLFVTLPTLRWLPNPCAGPFLCHICAAFALFARATYTYFLHPFTFTHLNDKF